MAFKSNGPVMLGLPAFRGLTRRVVLVGMAAFFGLLLLSLVTPAVAGRLVLGSMLTPELVWPQVWRLATYSLLLSGFANTLFALLTVWMFGMQVEDERGERWLREYIIVAAVGGGLLASVVWLVLERLMQDRGMQGSQALSFAAATAGPWPLVNALVVAYGVLFAEMEILFLFVVRMKAKYLAAIYVVVYAALALGGGDRFGALTTLCAMGCGYGYLRLAPRKGLGWAGSEMWFGWRNAYYRAKRRRAARKFTVYMKKQGKDVNIDEDGRYVDPGGKPRDPNDRRWMN
jgi:membrane associated rhomboid family serine protease